MDYVPGTTQVGAVDLLLKDRQQLLSLLKHNLIAAQERLKWYADKKRWTGQERMCHASNPIIKIGMWQLPHTYKVSPLQVCKAFLATKKIGRAHVWTPVTA